MPPGLKMAYRAAGLALWQLQVPAQRAGRVCRAEQAAPLQFRHDVVGEILQPALSVPRQCALMGFGDYPFSHLLLPSLTTIRPPAQAIGELAARRILEALGEIEPEEASPRLNLLGCELLAREST